MAFFSSSPKWAKAGYVKASFPVILKYFTIKKSFSLLYKTNILHVAVRLCKNWFMLRVRISSYGCPREVWRARKKRKSCSKRSGEQL